MKKPLILSIIGGGLTGTSMLYQLLKKINSSPKKPLDLAIHFFEQKKRIGPGWPYDKDNIFSFHISNMPAIQMSIDTDNEDDLVKWFERNKPLLMDRFSDFKEWFCDQTFKNDNLEIYPRAVMGEYLKARFETALEIAKKENIKIVLHSMCEVTNIEDHGSFLLIEVFSQKKEMHYKVLSNRVLLATGHWSNKRNEPGYFSSPWPGKKLLDHIPQGSSVGIIGTSLSAIDTVLTLFCDGKFLRDNNGKLHYIPSQNPRHITMFSRKGLLAKVRGKNGVYKNQHFCKSSINDLLKKSNNELNLIELFDLLKKELETAYNKKINWKKFFSPGNDCLPNLKKDVFIAKNGDNPKGDILWQTIFNQAIPLITKAYQKLTPEHRQWFEKDFKSVFMNHASVIPIINAEKMIALMEKKLLHVQKLGDTYQFSKTTNKAGYKFSYQDDKNKNKDAFFSYIIDARGQAVSYRTNLSLLAKNLLSSGIVQIEKPLENFESGSIWIDPETFRVITLDDLGNKSISKNIFAVGMMTRGQTLNASMAKECVHSTNSVADQIIKELF